MSSCGYILTNLVNGLTSINPAVMAAYPAANAYDGKSYKPVRWAATTIIPTVSASAACSGIAICNHNLATGAIMKVTPNGGAEITVYPKTGRSVWVPFPSSAASATVWIQNAVNIAIGEIIMGTPTAISRQFSYGHSDGMEYQNDIHLTEYGIPLEYEKYNARVLKLPFNVVTTAVRDQVDLIYATTKGGLTPFLFIHDVAGNDCIYARCGIVAQSSSVSYGFWNITLDLREEPSAVIVS